MQHIALTSALHLQLFTIGHNVRTLTFQRILDSTSAPSLSRQKFKVWEEIFDCFPGNEEELEAVEEAFFASPRFAPEASTLSLNNLQKRRKKIVKRF